MAVVVVVCRVQLCISGFNRRSATPRDHRARESVETSSPTWIGRSLLELLVFVVQGRHCKLVKD